VKVCQGCARASDGILKRLKGMWMSSKMSFRRISLRRYSSRIVGMKLGDFLVVALDGWCRMGLRLRET
jgi:hypothetical protein